MSIADQINGAESRGDLNATNPRSSAAGPGQFLNATWLQMIRRHRPDLAQGRSDQEILALRTDPALGPQLNADMTGAYAQQNTPVLTNAGFQATPGNLYLAHFAGPGGALKVLRADPGGSAAETLGPAVAAANPFLARMTNSQLVAWADRRIAEQNVPRPPADIPQQPPATPQPGMLAGAGLAGAGSPGMLAGGAPLALAPPSAAGGDAAPAPPVQPLAPGALQSAALGVPPQPGAAPFSLANLLPRPMTAAEQSAWFARQNPTG